LDINSIIVPTSRQRQSAKEVDDQFVASVARRLINPITLRQTDDGPTLVAGERRLIALKRTGLLELTHHIHFRFLDELSPDEAEIVELEENVKREDLGWRDHVAAVARVYSLLKKRKLTDGAIAVELSTSPGSLSMALFVFRNLESSNLRDATSYRQAYSILQSISERRTVSIVADLARAGNKLFEDKSDDNQPSDNSDRNDTLNNPSSTSSSTTEPRLDSSSRLDSRDLEFRPPSNSPVILNQDFISWAATYSGDKFTFIHCDFPYDVKYDSYARSISSVTDDYDFSGFWPLADALCDNIDRLMSYSAHLMFWFSMKFYGPTKERLEKAGLYVHDHPLIWHKTDNSGIIPGRDAIFPRRTYETAFLATRGRRPLVRSLANIHGAPMASNSIHPSQKPEPVLRHFFGMLIDEATEVLDPTAGSGTALRVADELGARRIVGLELDPAYAKAANSAIQTARGLRRITS
jgi:DNA methylase